MAFQGSRSIVAFTPRCCGWNMNRFGEVHCAAAHGKTESNVHLKKVDATFGMFQLVLQLPNFVFGESIFFAEERSRVLFKQLTLGGFFDV